MPTDAPGQLSPVLTDQRHAYILEPPRAASHQPAEERQHHIVVVPQGRLGEQVALTLQPEVTIRSFQRRLRSGLRPPSSTGTRLVTSPIFPADRAENGPATHMATTVPQGRSLTNSGWLRP